MCYEPENDQDQLQRQCGCGAFHNVHTDAAESARLSPEDIPADFPVRPLRPGENAESLTTCGTCGLSWDDAVVTSWTPVPSARCPFEYFHEDEEVLV